MDNVMMIDGTPNLLELVEASPVDPIEMLAMDVAVVLLPSFHHVRMQYRTP